MAKPLQITMKATDVFFDRAKIQALMDRKTARSLSRAGAFLRRRQRSSLRRRKRASKPGQTPSVHSRDNVATIRNILFGYDARTQTVVSGMVKLHGHQYIGTELATGTVPRVLEFGGTVGLREKQRYPGGTWTSMHTVAMQRPGERRRVRRATYKPRPSAGPALDTEIAAGTIPKQWAQGVA